MPNCTAVFARSEIGFTGTLKLTISATKFMKTKNNLKNYIWQQLKSLGYCYTPRVVFLTSMMIYVLIHVKLLTILIVLLLSLLNWLLNSLLAQTNLVPTLRSSKTITSIKGLPLIVLNELKTLNISKSTGPNNIPGRFLRASELKKPITHIIKLCILSNTVPDGFNIARVQPLFKRDSRTDVSNYRPISILCIFSKLLGKTVYIQVEEYFTENNILYNLQSGFRGTFTIDTCLIHLTDHIHFQMSLGNTQEWL